MNSSVDYSVKVFVRLVGFVYTLAVTCTPASVLLAKIASSLAPGVRKACKHVVCDGDRASEL